MCNHIFSKLLLSTVPHCQNMGSHLDVLPPCLLWNCAVYLCPLDLFWQLEMLWMQLPLV